MENDAKMREKYLAPEVEVMEVALEKGFAVSLGHNVSTQAFETETINGQGGLSGVHWGETQSEWNE